MMAKNSEIMALSSNSTGIKKILQEFSELQEFNLQERL